MRRIFLVLALALLASLSAWANGLTCHCTGACTLLSATNWTSCGATFPAQGAGVDDGIVVDSGGSLSWDQTGTRTYRNFWVKPGGSATVTVSPVVMQFDGPVFTVGANTEMWFVVGDVADARGTFISDNKDLTISWIGAASGVMMTLGPQPFGAPDLTANYTNVTMRGVLRADTYAGVYSQGATATEADFVDCIKWPAGFSPASTPVLGDTIVFTTGRSQEFWYKVVTATAECTNQCGGAACDVQIDRAATDATPGSVAASRTWSSMAMTASVGGPSRHTTPVDSDANGTANSSGTRPITGDKFVIFKPVLIQGGTNPILNGTVVHFTGANIDWRYVEVNKGSGQDAENCSGGQGGTVFWDTDAKIASAEGAMEFINLHDFASRQGAWEVSQTDRPDDLRPNVPRTYKHVYVHDVDAFVGTTCPGQGVNGAGAGPQFFQDMIDGTQDGITFDGLHVARWGDGAGINITRTGAVQRNITLRNLVIHDWPGISGYGQAGSTITDNAIGPIAVDGIATWDLGATSRASAGIAAFPGVQSCLGAGNPLVCCTGAGTGPTCAPTTIDVRNAFIVNIDGNAAPGGNQDAPGDISAVQASVGRTPEDTSTVVVSNSYISRIVGGAGEGGTFRFNFIKDTNIEDDGAAPCVTGGGVFTNNVELTGNVITRASAIACMESGLYIRDSANPNGLTKRTRRVVSNVFHNLFSDNNALVAGLRLYTAAATIGIDVYNNVFDFNGLSTNADVYGLLDTAGPSAPFKLTAYYNVFEGLTDAAGGGYAILNFTGVRDEGYNRIMNATQSPACSPAACAGTDIDSDIENVFTDRPNFRMGQRCDSPEMRRNPWGGPVGPLRFGIQGFERFHPAVLPLMDADAFKRYDWRECSRVYQDLLPR